MLLVKTPKTIDKKYLLAYNKRNLIQFPLQNYFRFYSWPFLVKIWGFPVF